MFFFLPPPPSKHRGGEGEGSWFGSEEGDLCMFRWAWEWRGRRAVT